MKIGNLLIAFVFLTSSLSTFAQDPSCGRCSCPRIEYDTIFCGIDDCSSSRFGSFCVGIPCYGATSCSKCFENTIECCGVPSVPRAYYFGDCLGGPDPLVPTRAAIDILGPDVLLLSCQGEYVPSKLRSAEEEKVQ